MAVKIIKETHETFVCSNLPRNTSKLLPEKATVPPPRRTRARRTTLQPAPTDCEYGGLRCLRAFK